MEQPSYSGKEQCPINTSHEGHNWRYEDQPAAYYKRCVGLIVPIVDVIKRFPDEDR